MSKRNPDKIRTAHVPTRGQPRNPIAQARRPIPWARVLISGLILFHLCAVVAEPFRMFTSSARGGSPVADSIRRFLAPYVEFAYLNHGYFFFAPEPGPSHLMECRLSGPNEQVRRLRLPDQRAQWPRLLYHRHFMLAEFLNTIFVPSQLTEEAARVEGVREQWARSRRVYEMIRGSMEGHLTKTYNCASTEIRRVEHRWPTAYEVFSAQWSLDDERLYILLPDSPPVEPLLHPPVNSVAPTAASHSTFPDRPSAPEEIRP